MKIKIIKAIAWLLLSGIIIYINLCWFDMYGFWTTMGAYGFFALLGLLVFVVSLPNREPNVQAGGATDAASSTDDGNNKPHAY